MDDYLLQGYQFTSGINVTDNSQCTLGDDFGGQTVDGMAFYKISEGKSISDDGNWSGGLFLPLIV